MFIYLYIYMYISGTWALCTEMAQAIAGGTCERVHLRTSLLANPNEAGLKYFHTRLG